MGSFFLFFSIYRLLNIQAVAYKMNRYLPKFPVSSSLFFAGAYGDA